MPRATQIVLVVGSIWVGTTISASAQTVNYSRVEALSGLALQLNYHATANKNCSPSPAPTIRVIDVPRFGTLAVRKGEATIGSVPGCQPFKTPAEVVIYTARPTYVGSDHVKYEVTSSNGQVDDFDITIDVKRGPPNSSPAKPEDRL